MGGAWQGLSGVLSAMAIHEASFEPEQREHTRFIYRMLADSAGAQVDEGLVSELLRGSYELHVHAGPDSYAGRTWSEIDTALAACEAGMGGIVFKCHSAPSSARTDFVKRYVYEMCEEGGWHKTEIYGGVVLNYPVGGVNPHAVRASLKMGGRFVWTAVMDSEHHRKVTGQGGGIRFVEKGKVVEPMHEILDLIAEHDAVLSLSHLGTEERFIYIEEAKRHGVRRILIDHPQLSIVKATPEQLREMAQMGALIGFYWQAAVPNLFNFAVKPTEMLDYLRVVTAEHLASGTDLGQYGNPHPVDGMRMFLRTLLFFGVSREDIETIFKKNPRRLIHGEGSVRSSDRTSP